MSVRSDFAIWARACSNRAPYAYARRIPFNERMVNNPEGIRVPRRGLVLRSLSVVSEARVSKLHTRARCVCALSIQRQVLVLYRKRE
jgi:hypothetical protein